MPPHLCVNLSLFFFSPKIINRIHEIIKYRIDRMRSCTSNVLVFAHFSLRCFVLFHFIIYSITFHRTLSCTQSSKLQKTYLFIRQEKSKQKESQWSKGRPNKRKERSEHTRIRAGYTCRSTKTYQHRAGRMYCRQPISMFYGVLICSQNFKFESEPRTNIHIHLQIHAYTIYMRTNFEPHTIEKAITSIQLNFARLFGWKQQRQKKN